MEDKLASFRLFSLNKADNKQDSATRASDKVESELIKMIISLQLAPGSMINEAELTKTLKCGRTPLREALLRLSQENLIVSIPRRGMFVAELDLMNFVKLIEAASLIESFSTYLAVEQCSNDEIDTLEKATINAKAAFGRKDLLAVAQFDFDFHVRIAEFTHNEYIVQAIIRLYRLINRYFYISLKNGLDVTQSAEEHLRIVKAFRRRNAEEAKNFMYLHSLEARDRISSTLLNAGRPVFPSQIPGENNNQNNTIRVGVPTMMTGPGAPMGADIIAGIGMAVQNINKKGGVLGKKLEIVYADIKDTNPEDSRLGGELLANAKVSAFFPGGFYDPSCPIEFARYRQPLFHASAIKDTVDPIAANLHEYGNVFQVCASEEKLGPNAFTNLLSLPYKYPNKKIAMLGSDISYDMYLQQGIVRHAQSFDWEIILNDCYPFGSTRFDPQLARIRAENPAIIFGCITSTESAIEFVNQFLQNPTNSLIFLHWAPGASKFIQTLGDKADGILWQTEFGYLPTRENVEWIEEFTAEFGREPGVAWPAMMDDMLNIWIKAVEHTGDPNDYEKVIEYVRHLSQHPYEGRTGRYGINPERNEGLSGLDWLPIHTYQIQHQKNILLFLDTEPFMGNDVVSQGNFMIPPWIQNLSFNKK
jgi:branched-chain amino acid transport system substrate-binding protein